MKDKYKQDFTWEKCLSEFFLIYKEEDEHAKQIIEKIQNSIELRKAKK